MRTSVLAAKRALRELIRADDTFDGFLIRMGLPSEEATVPERIYVLDNQPREYAPATEQGGLNEAFILPVIVEVRLFGDDKSEALRDEGEDRMEDLIEALVSLVEGVDQPLDGAVWQAGLERIVGPNSAPMLDGWICQCTVEFGVATGIF